MLSALRQTSTLHLRLTDFRMKDMMTVLLESVLRFHAPARHSNWSPCSLNGVTDPQKKAPDGTTIEGRVQKLSEDVAEDIKKCAGACETYLR